MHIRTTNTYKYMVEVENERMEPSSIWSAERPKVEKNDNVKESECVKCRLVVLNRPSWSSSESRNKLREASTHVACVQQLEVDYHLETCSREARFLLTRFTHLLPAPDGPCTVGAADVARSHAFGS